MKMVKMLIHVPQPVKDKLDALRTEGMTASDYIRKLLEREFTHPRKGRNAR
jgi:Arc/MetJ-type ribon-helix-helix transcriptional regulator